MYRSRPIMNVRLGGDGTRHRPKRSIHRSISARSQLPSRKWSFPNVTCFWNMLSLNMHKKPINRKSKPTLRVLENRTLPAGYNSLVSLTDPGQFSDSASGSILDESYYSGSRVNVLSSDG